MSRVYLIILMIFSFTLHANDGDKIIIEQRSDISSLVEMKRINAKGVDNIVAGGTVSNSCVIQDFRRIYSEDQAVVSATRDYAESIIKLYGVANGFGPTYPGKQCHGKTKYFKVILWPTNRCEHDLSFEQAITFSEKYNNKMSLLVCGK